MNILANDVVSCIFEYLVTRDLILASRTTKKWRKIFNNTLWKYKIDLRSNATDNALVHLKGVKYINLRILIK